jgi:hypothetical protein
MTHTAEPMTLPEEVQYALDRMCTPLDESVLCGATAREDARCMRIIRDYIDAELAKQREAEPVEDYRTCMVRTMARMLENKEWADLFVIDESLAWLQSEISKLVAELTALKSRISEALEVNAPTPPKSASVPVERLQKIFNQAHMTGYGRAIPLSIIQDLIAEYK